MKSLFLLPPLLALLPFAAAAQSPLGTVPTRSELRIVGTGNGMDMVQAVSALFMSTRPDIVISVPPSIRSSGGVRALLERSAPLARIARPLTQPERSNGLRERLIARLPAAIFVHPDIALRGVTGAQLAGLFTGAISNWSEIGGPHLRVRVVRRAEGDAGLSALRRTMPGWSALVFTPRHRHADTSQDAIEVVHSTPGAISVGTYSRQLEGYLGVLRVDGKHPTDPAYPSMVDLRIAWREDAMSAPLQAYLDFWSIPQARALMESFGAVLPPE